MMHTRRVLGVGAAAVIVTGLLLPTQAAVAAAGPCPSGTEDSINKVFHLSADCVLNATWDVPDGWTIHGHGHTITAPGVTGAVIKSTGGGNLASMTVGHLTIDTAGAGANIDGILFDGATGRVNDVTIKGGADYGVEIRSSVPFAAGDHVKVDNGTTISGYQKAAVFAHDDVKLDVLRAAIGSPGAASGDISGVLMTEGAHGSVKESHIRLSDSEPSPSETSFGAGVRIEKDNSPTLLRRVEVKRNVFSGTDADFGISVTNEGQTKKLTVDTNCNLFRRHDTSAHDPYGVGVARWQNTSLTNLLVSNSTFQGNWNRATGTVVGMTVTAGPPNTLARSTSTCPPGAPRHVNAKGGDQKIKVTWRRAHAPAYAPLTGYRVTAKTKGHPAITKKVGPRATSVVLKRLKNNRSFVVTVTARSNGGKASATDRTRTG